MNREQLLETDKYYKDNIDNWLFLDAAESGVESLIKYGVLKGVFKDPEQYLENGAAFGFEYTRRINEILTGFIINSNFNSYYDTLSNDALFQMFMGDCDLNGTDYEAWCNERREVVSLMGHIGIFVDMARFTGTPQALIDNKIYPYLSSYSPIDVLQMPIIRDEITNRPKFSKVKLREYNPDRVIILTPENIQVWELPEDDEAEAIQINAGNDINPLGVIPFFLWINKRKPGTMTTLSNVRGIADIDVSLIKDNIRGDKLIHNAAFPNLVTAAEQEGAPPEQQIKTGVNQIFTETPEEKGIHRWISSEAASAIQPLRDLMGDKRTEIYLMANLGAILQTVSRDARSGESLKESFKYLEGSLKKMVSNELEARRNIFRFWLKWLNKEDEFQKISISHDGDFDIESLILEIADLLTEKSLLSSSSTAQKEIEKKIVRIGSLKGLGQKTLGQIDTEIDNYSASESLPDVGE